MSKRILKFDGGSPVLLCTKCRKTIREATTEDWYNKRAVYCDYCKEQKKNRNTKD